MSRVLYRHLNLLILSRARQIQVLTINKRYYQITHKGPTKFSTHLFEQKLHTSTALHKVIPYTLSDIGEGIFEVTIKEWYIQPGDTVKQFQEICEVQSDKAAVTITCRYDGVIKKLYHQQDALCKVGTPLVDIEVADDVEGGKVEKQEADSGKDEVTPSVDTTTDREVKVLATPPVRKLAKDLGVNITDVIGTGRDGRVLKEDLHNFVKPLYDSKTPTTVSWQPRPIVTSSEDKTMKLTPIQTVMIRTMTLSGRIPQFGYCDEIKAGKLREFKKLLQDIYSSRDGISLTYMPIFLKATSIALSRFPILNSVYDETEGTMIYKPYHNIGLAMDTQHGLLVPNVKNVEQKSIIEIAVELMEMHKLGVSGKIKPEQLTGGTFSISNIGAIGGTYSRPMILPPEVCIVAIGRIYQPGGIGDYVINTSYSADHRVIDGATVSRFSNFWKELIEEPALISAELT
ncbi:Lipoamide acyltransferase component of branched-chain alpha-keto acid dehydrogenase complex, mitochondrial isoform X2 [Oopsacas minuta]|uniref:Dihydrolipoamide acetyltransferase component of pyruvate dehydrogenase complex n=1 Tax=Oopsacas minuta TaxID=111878 RepID=A0AAV7K738_9METZ|nr:Lipoamide acyltransferase component of branched-chain alpha-keto acid dehydrogenase complex, mitochondrial isoform X2 [Oopsacas minuta]